MAWRDPWDTVDRANALRAQTDAQTVGMLGSLQGMQMNALQRQNLERQMADERAVREAYTQGAGDPTRTRDLLTRGGFYRQVQDMDKAALDKRKTEASIGKDEADAAVKRAQMERDAIAGINDQAGWDAFRQSIGDRAGRLPAQFSPEVKLSLVTRADDYVKRMTPDFKEMDLGGKRVTVDMNPYTNPAIRGAEFGKTATIGEQETARHNQVQEGISRGNLGVAQANLGLSRQRLDMERNMPRGQFDAERGILIDPRTAQAQPVTMGGQPIGPKEKNLNDAQSKALLFGSRMLESERVISNLAKEGTTTSVPGSRSGYGVGAVINTLQSSNQQSLDQAKRDFINAVLRRESGAVISDSEFRNAEQQYFPQVGDSESTRKQKAANRQTAIKGILEEVPEARRPRAPQANSGGASGDFGEWKIERVQ